MGGLYLWLHWCAWFGQYICVYLSGVFFPLCTVVDTRVKKKKETGCMLMVRKGVCVVLLYGRSLVGVYDNNIYMSDKVVCLVDKGGTFSGLVVSSQGAWKCVLILLAVLHQPVYKSVCKCVWRWTVENGLRAMDRLP